jgi:hypothetical protein
LDVKPKRDVGVAAPKADNQHIGVFLHDCATSSRPRSDQPADVVARDGVEPDHSALEELERIGERLSRHAFSMTMGCEIVASRRRSAQGRS